MIVLAIIVVLSAFVVTKLYSYAGTIGCVVKTAFSGNCENFTCNRDGLTISGKVFHTDMEKQPILIISHAFMANKWFSYAHAEYLLKLGYAVFTFDFNGGCLLGKSEGKKTDMSVLTEVEDLKAVIEYAKNCPYTDEQKIVLMGCSQGGFVSAITASQLTDTVDKLILFYPALSIPDDARSGSMIYAEFDPLHVPDSFMCGPMRLGKCYVEDVLQMDAYEAIGNYTGDVLLLHGGKDSVVDKAYSDKAYKTYTSAGAHVIYRIIDNADHVFFQYKDYKKAKNIVKKFLKG